MKQRLKLISKREEQEVDALSDDALMRLSALNRLDAFEALVTRHHALVFGLATRFLGNRQSGWDVAQDVFLALWAERGRYREKGAFRSYLVSVCINRCRVVARGIRNRERKNARFSMQSAPPLFDEAEAPLDTLLKQEQRREIQRYLSKLPEKCREVMIYRFTHEMSIAEIADVTGMPIGTVKSHIRRGLLSIRRMMKKSGSA